MTAIAKTSPRYFLGSLIPNVKLLSSKIDTIITKLNTVSSTDNTLLANTISEVTSANGVAIDGLTIKDSRFEYNSTGYFGTTKTADATLTIDETGFIFANRTTSFTLTLPATVAGYSYFIVNIDGSAVVNISPNASDYIAGSGLTKVDNKDLIIPAVKGAYAQIIADGVNGWYLAQASGTLTKEA